MSVWGSQGLSKLSFGSFVRNSCLRSRCAGCIGVDYFRDEDHVSRGHQLPEAAEFGRKTTHVDTGGVFITRSSSYFTVDVLTSIYHYLVYRISWLAGASMTTILNQTHDVDTLVTRHNATSSPNGGHMDSARGHIHVCIR